MQTPVWTPKHPEASQMWQFMRFVEKKHQQSFEGYAQLHTWSVDHPADFWVSLCDFFKIHFDTPASHIIENGDDMLATRWFTGARFNFAETLLLRNDTHPAIISIDENGSRQVLSYHALRQQVADCAEGLKDAGIGAGDRVAAIMPNVAYTIIAMLATTSLGAIWSSCSPDFGAAAIVDRFSQIEPKLVFVGNGHQYHGKVHEATTKIKHIALELPSVKQWVVCPILQETYALEGVNHTSWHDFLKPSAELTFVPQDFSHPVYILFSSGTTGKPKCIVHGAGGTLLQHIKELALHTDLQPDDNLCFYTTCGWMMWHWMVSGLALGITLTLYEGSPTYPNAHRLFQLIDDEQVSVFGTSAKFISCIEKEEISPRRQHNLLSLRAILSTGSPLLPFNYDFVYEHIKPEVQLSSISGGTDIVSCFALGNPLLPVYKGELQCIGLGMDVRVFDEQGHAVQQQRGELVCTKPFPSMPVSFWHDNDKSRYRHAYFERFNNVWAHGDFAELTEHGGLIIYGRSDAILNPGGVRIGTAEIYRQVEKIPEVLNSIVIGQTWQEDIRVVLFVQLHKNRNLTEALQAKIRQTIRDNASPRHVPAKILQVSDIPRTINGKIVEIAVRQAVHGEPIPNLESLANPHALTDFKNRVELQS